MQVDTIKVLTDAIGEDLAGQFQAIAELGDGARSKYDDSVMRQLRRMIVCRNYGRALLELSHFTAALGIAAGGQQGMIGLLWGMERATSHSFRQAFDDCYYEGPQLTLTSEGVTLTALGEPFAIHYNRMPLLSALMDFVTGIIGFDHLAVADKAAVTEDCSDDIQTATRAMQSALYDWLKDQLHANQEQRKYRRLIDYAGKREIDDALVLDFWREEALSDDSDFRSFETAADCFISLLKIRESVTSKQAAGYASRLGTDRDQGETDPDAIAANLADWVEDEADPLEQLAAAPLDDIKFLTGKTMASFAPVISAREQARRLPMTILRKTSFGRAQRSLTEAARRQERNLEEALTAAMDEGDGVAQSALHYDQLVALWRMQIDDVYRTEWATAALLLNGKQAAGLVALSALAPDIDMQSFENAMTLPEDKGADVVSLGAWRQQQAGQDPVSQLYASLPDLRQQHPALSTGLDRAARELKNIARKGFRPTDVATDDERLDGLEAGLAVLQVIQREMRGFLSHLPAAAENYGADRSIFIDMYRQLYQDSLKGHA